MTLIEAFVFGAIGGILVAVVINNWEDWFNAFFEFKWRNRP